MVEIPYRLPLVIGATGHRDLREQDIPALKRAVADVIERIKRDYLHGDTETPIIVLSSLAEGADRLIAGVAMDHGARLIAPLPMPPDEYRRDFEHGLKPDAVAEFNRLLAKAVEAPAIPYAKGNSLEAIQADQEKRDLQYREVGLFIVRHCHVLIALWNGDEQNMAVGGTTEVVMFKRDGIPLDVTGSARASLDAPEIGPVIHIVTPRTKPGGNATGVAVGAWGREVVKQHRGGLFRRSRQRIVRIVSSLFDTEPRSDSETPELRAWETFAVQTAMTRQFNREVADLACVPGSAGRLDVSLRYLFEDSTENAAGEAARARATELLPRWCALYAIADTLAQNWQSWFKRDWQVLFSLGFVAIVAFEVVTHLFPSMSPLFVGYSIAFVCVFVYLVFARLRRHQERYLDYRALAEALRVAVFWKLLGIGVSSQAGPKNADKPSSVDLSSGESVADAYPIRQPRELDWVKTCLRALELLDERSAHPGPEHRRELEFYACARNSWVNGQLGFFRRRGPQHDRQADVFEIRSVAFLIVSIILASILYAFEHYRDWHHGELPYGIAIFGIGLSAAIAAIFAGYSEKLALNAQARQYDRMRALFERAYDLLPEKVAPADFRQMQALFAELGAEAMKENAEWVAIYRQRPIRPP
jgi:hypothetical protein